MSIRSTAQLERAAAHVTPELKAHILGTLHRVGGCTQDALIVQHYPPRNLGIPAGLLSGAIRLASQELLDEGRVYAIQSRLHVTRSAA